MARQAPAPSDAAEESDRHREILLDLLYDYPFGGVEIQNMRSVMDFVARRYPGVRATKTPEEIVEWLRSFHTMLAERLHVAQSVLDLIPD